MLILPYLILDGGAEALVPTDVGGHGGGRRCIICNKQAHRTLIAFSTFSYGSTNRATLSPAERASQNK